MKYIFALASLAGLALAATSDSGDHVVSLYDFEIRYNHCAVRPVLLCFSLARTC